MARRYTIMVIPERGGAARTYKVSRGWIRAGIITGVVLLVVSAVVAVHQGYLWLRLDGEAARNEALETENLELRARVEGVEGRIDSIGSALEDVERMDARIRAMTLLADPGRHLEIGPLPDRGGPTPADLAEVSTLPGLNAREAKLARAARLEVLDLRAEVAAAEAVERKRSLETLESYFDGRESMLASTPSVWPVRGYVTSRFGPRIDSLTGVRRTHPGIDVSVPLGTPVRATADGRVVFVEEDGGYGMLVEIDHGHGITTRYAHLSDYKVSLNTNVKRGDVIALSGNSGRSTGPHLHYEVRLYGVPENPYNYILE